MAEFMSNIDKIVEWVGCAETVEEVNEVVDNEEVDYEDFGSRSDLDDEEGESRKALRKVA